MVPANRTNQRLRHSINHIIHLFTSLWLKPHDGIPCKSNSSPISQSRSGQSTCTAATIGNTAPRSTPRIRAGRPSDNSTGFFKSTNIFGLPSRTSDEISRDRRILRHQAWNNSIRSLHRDNNWHRRTFHAHAGFRGSQIDAFLIDADPMATCTACICVRHPSNVLPVVAGANAP